jgi:integrase
LRLQLGLGKLPDDALVFCRPDGSPIPPNDVSRDWARVCASKDLPQVGFHALRHTHASALISSGMDVVAISRRLGHKSPTTTLRIYAHLFAKLAKDAAAADAIEAVMRGGTK